MADVITHSYSNLASAVRDVVSAHAEIHDKITNHAERVAAEHDQARRDLEIEANLQVGAQRHAS